MFSSDIRIQISLSMIVKSLTIFLLFSWPSLQEARAEQGTLPHTMQVQSAGAPVTVDLSNQSNGTSTGFEQTHSLTRTRICFDEIDAAAEAFENGRADIARNRLTLLTQSCASVPHLFHNLGAIAMLNRNWDEAIDYLEQSLALDQRAAMTQKTLSDIYQYKAAVAYKNALNLNGPDPRMPSTRMQSSDLGNSLSAHSPSDPPSGNLERPPISTDTSESIEFPNTGQWLTEVQFEVSNWWKAQLEYDIDTYFAYYADDKYPADFTSAQQWRDQWSAWRENQTPRLPAWDEVQFFAEPLEDYILVNLRFPTNALGIMGSTPDESTENVSVETPANYNDADHAFLVMKKNEQRWQIVKEKSW